MIEATLYFRFKDCGVGNACVDVGARVFLNEDGLFDSEVAVDDILATADSHTSPAYGYVRVGGKTGWVEFPVERVDECRMRIIDANFDIATFQPALRQQ